MSELSHGDGQEISATIISSHPMKEEENGGTLMVAMQPGVEVRFLTKQLENGRHLFVAPPSCLLEFVREDIQISVDK